MTEHKFEVIDMVTGEVLNRFINEMQAALWAILNAPNAFVKRAA